MRPVRLDINGFASFREPAVVDFTDVEYFALVGPTGSGKSTVIDALTFALYGTAPRWGRTNAIADALAPTTNRCTVSLTFDVGAQRYQVAREIRRVGTTIQQKNVSLVRFTDPNANVVDADVPQPEVLAGDIKEVNRAIDELLGLSFEDFCQCVVLPQGEFARFLSATPSVRQLILLKLLGAAHYEGIGKMAGAQAANASREVEFLTQQLARHADATSEAESEAAAAVDALARLEDFVRDLVPHFVDVQANAAAAAGRARTLQAEQGLLDAVAVPDGVDELQRDATIAEAAADQSREVSDEAAKAFRDTTAAAAAGPQRATVTPAAERYTERATLSGRRDEVAAHAARTQEDASRRQTQLTDAAEAVTSARTRTDVCRTGHDLVQETQTALLRRHERLITVRAPAEVSDLAARALEVSHHVEQTAGALTDARARRTEATDALTGATGRDRIDQARDELARHTDATTSLTAATTDLDTTRAAATHAGSAQSAAETRLEEANEALGVARTLAGVAQLRPNLQVGDDCPVCDQRVTTLPPALADPAMDVAQAARAAAEREHGAAVAAQHEAGVQVTARQRTVDTLTERWNQVEAQLVGRFPDRPAGVHRDAAADSAHLDELAGTQARLEAAAAQTERGLDAAERAHTAADWERTVLDQDLSAERGRVQHLLGTLADLEPPTVDVVDLSATWTHLEAWARSEVATLPDHLAAAAEAVTAAKAERKHADAALAQAELAYTAAQTEHTAAVRAASTAEQQCSLLTSRLSELDSLLASAPPADQLDALLAECVRLELAVATASANATTAQHAAAAAAREHQQWRARVTDARVALNASRDHVAPLSPPALDPADLAAGWATLATWAQQGARERRERIAQAGAEADTATGQEQRLFGELEGLLRDRDIDPADLGTGPTRATEAPRVVAVAVERARGRRAAIQASLAEASRLRDQIGSARTRQQVATELSGLMRSDKFPRWLVEAGLDTLVAAASRSLRHLSGDQFDLTHKKGEFYVIDHADADSERSVRTLSGGETFQASLSLALALSEQLAGMGGGTKLESIFLDEGFGTLDPDSLETVAETLENLAHGERMVGVVTHVSALAERAPVRYQVRRDSRTSVVIREGA